MLMYRSVLVSVQCLTCVNVVAENEADAALLNTALECQADGRSDSEPVVAMVR
jgi:hypothetical protein